MPVIRLKPEQLRQAIAKHEVPHQHPTAIAMLGSNAEKRREFIQMKQVDWDGWSLQDAYRLLHRIYQEIQETLYKE